MTKIIARIKGGIGNQLFCYAAARRLALSDSAELIIDDVTGFERDRQYRRQYALDHFHISCKKATPAERLEPFERYRRALLKWLSRRRPFPKRRYLEQEKVEFDGRLLELSVNGTLYLDGYWQSEKYFKDIETVIRDDLKMIPPVDEINMHIADDIRSGNAVAIHVRWFDAINNRGSCNITANYYRKAISIIEQKVESPRYFVFSDDPVAAAQKIALPEGRWTLVSHNHGDQNAYADLWLMTQCKHFVTANSTFSWWGAWLGNNKNKMVLTPNIQIQGVTSWGFKGLIPENWMKI